MAAKFNVGDVIRLKSGGPPMTVEDPDVEDHYGKKLNKVSTVWFAGAKRETGRFDMETVEKVPPKAAPGE
jgi:uncharacterized protein YodC (DUF2158 family)